MRQGAELLPVEEPEQRRDGLYMMGQVAALRREVTTMAALHEEVSSGATAWLASRAGDAVAEPTEEPARPASVAIVGMACVYPGSGDVREFWGHVVAGRDLVTEVPSSRWSADTFYDPDGDGEKTPSRWGGFIPAVPFDPLAFGIPPRSVPSVEPVQLLSLEVARRALDDAGYTRRPFDRQRTSVIFGVEAGMDLSGAYGFRALYPHYVGPIPDELDALLPRLTEDSFPGVLANVISGRIANRLDLGGVNYTVDAACASSLTAVDHALKELVGGTSDMVLCGGADLHNSINDYLMFASVHALSPNGRCRTFDAKADGIVLGEGVACVVLKRLDDAERDGDHVYAVIDGVAGSSDGRALGLTAPRKAGQARALRRAYRRSGVSAAEVGLVEAHGTGTVVGDRTELGTLTEVFTEAGADPASCALGSVKSQIGHTKCAAGMAGLIKVALAVERGVIPPTLHVEAPNPAWRPDESPFTLSARARPWVGAERIAGVSAFGFGGTNFHAVVRRHDGGDAPRSGLESWPAELFVFRGRTRDAARATVARVRAWLDADARVTLRDLACSVAATHPKERVWLALVATDLADLRVKLDVEREDPRGVFPAEDEQPPRTVAFLFPGQGSQRPGMLSDIFVACPELQELLDLAPDVAERMFPADAWSDEAADIQRAELTDTRMAQPALGIADLAMARVLERLGIQPAMLGGHSYGELVALAVAGVIDGPRTLVDLSRARANAILAAAGADPGTMAAVRAPAAEVAEVIEGTGAVLANLNGPKQTVIAGTTPAVEEAVRRLTEAGLTAKALPVACAFHSPVVASARDTMHQVLEGVPLGAPSVPVYANATAGRYSGAAEDTRALFADQIAKPVRFAEQLEAMAAAGADVFVEVGPGTVLTRLTRRCLGKSGVAAIATDGADGLRHLLVALARLAALGVELDPAPLFEGRGARRFDLSAAPPELPSTSWLISGHLARPLSGPPPAGGLQLIEQPLGLTLAAEHADPVDEREETVREYLAGLRELVAAQKDVMLTYLGGAPAEVAAQPRVVEVVAEPTVALPVDVAAELDAAAPAASVRDTLVAIVSDRTGYPPDMLADDLDLEADLGIDSIKRIEILGALRDQLGAAFVAVDDRPEDELLEELSRLKTLREIVGWFGDMEAATPLGRYVLRATPVAPATGDATAQLGGRRVAITDDQGGVAPALAALLAEAGAVVRVLGPEESPADVDALVDLAGLGEAADHASVKRLFGLARTAVGGGASCVVAATGLDGVYGAPVAQDAAIPVGGAAGLLKSLKHEHPEVRVRLVNLPGDGAPADLAGTLLSELADPGGPLEVGYLGGERHTLQAQAEVLEVTDEAPLDDRSVVLLTGGARGITAAVAVALAKRHRCTLELIGRTAIDGAPDESEAVSAAADAPAIRRALIADGVKKPAEVERLTRGVIARREVRATLDAIHDCGGRATYHAADVRDRAGLQAVVADVYARHDRLDGLIHGAGVIDDRLLVDKTPDDFERVFDTKVEAALTLVDALRDDVRFVVFFGSVSGVFGNRGQTDYAAANDALDRLAWGLDQRVQARVVSVDWGPWAGAGMVSPELAREYERRGVDLIDPVAGVDALLGELGSASGDAQVIFTATDPTRLQSPGEAGG